MNNPGSYIFTVFLQETGAGEKNVIKEVVNGLLQYQKN